MTRIVLTAAERRAISGARFPFLRSLGLLAVLVATCPTDALATSQGCPSQAMAQSGARAAAKLRCHATAALTGGSVEPACLAKAERRLDTERANNCLTTDAQDALAATADAFLADVASILAPPLAPDLRACVAMKLRATATAAQGTLGCHARAVRRRVATASACLAAARQRLERRWRAAEARGACGTPDDLATIGTKLDAFAADVVRVVTPSPSALVGTYDLTFTFDPQVFVLGSTALGTIREGAAGEIRLDIQFDALDYLSVGGPIEATGDVTLDGYFIAGGDMYYGATGAVTTRTLGNEWRVAGSVNILFFDGRTFTTLTFSMVRPTSGTPSAFSGTYTFAFSPSPDGLGADSTASIAIDIPANGFGTSMPASEVDAAGTQRGTFGGGECLVSPQGQLRCRTTYDASDPSSPAAHCRDVFGSACPIALGGGLTMSPTGVAGGGDYLVVLAPFILGGGNWTAVK